jgi:hypothetical protein
VRNLALIVVAATASAICHADIVTDVNEAAIKVAGPPPALTTANVLALTNLAMFDAANAIEKRFVAYRPVAAPPAGVRADAAALAAGCATLTALVLPAQKAAVATACDDMAARLPAGAYSEEARRFGEGVAAALVAARSDAGLMAPSRYRPFTTAGTYVPTLLPIGWELLQAKPIMMTSPSQFRSLPPPALTSDTWTRDYNEVKALGSRTSETRTPEQTATAQFYALPGFSQYVASIAENAPAPTSIAASARYYALLYAILVDTAIAQFDSKYTYNFWRPVTAIRNGDLDDNPATEPDAGWTSLVEAPLHPEYPCAHCNTGTAFATVLAGLVCPGRRIVIRGGDNGRREFASASDLAADIVNARVYSGIHFRNSAEAGAVMGKQLGDYVVATQLRPLP